MLLPTMRLTAAFAVILLAVSCRPAAHQFDYSRDAGVAVEKDGRVCLEIRNRSLATGATVTLVTTPASQAQVVAQDSSCPSGNSGDSDLLRYQLRITAGALPPAVPAIALVGRPPDQPAFRACLSSEGIHLTIWAGKPLEGRRLWHQYYYVGYDLEPNCTPAETAERK